MQNPAVQVTVGLSVAWCILEVLFQVTPNHQTVTIPTSRVGLSGMSNNEAGNTEWLVEIIRIVHGREIESLLEQQRWWLRQPLLSEA